MPIEKIMEILNQFEVQSQREIKLDHAVNADNYASVGKFKLIKNIRKRLIKELFISDIIRKGENQCLK